MKINTMKLESFLRCSTWEGNRKGNALKLGVKETAHRFYKKKIFTLKPRRENCFVDR
jgi:hypothetical protein